MTRFRRGLGSVLLAAGLLARPPAAMAQTNDGPAGPASGAPVALIISNAAYAALPRLPTCELSANLVAAVLSRAGFKVLRQTNPSNARLGTAIATLGDDMAAATDSRSLIYICGYMASFSGRLFVLPVEARLEREEDVLSQGIVARLLMGAVAGPTSRAGLVLMDAAAAPDQKGRPAFESMLRPNDAAFGGLVAASLPAVETQGPAPLASALADLVPGGRLEIGAAIDALQARPGTARSLLFLRPPAQPAWLLGAAATPPPIQPQPAPQPVPQAVPPPAPAPAPAPVEPNAADRRRLQLALQRLGYFKGRVTGVFGPDTLAAIRTFQKDSEAEVTGRLTQRQVDQLLKP